MKNYLCFILVLVFLFAGTSLANTALNGTWQGTMEITPEQKLTIQFTFTQKDDGSYKAVLNSPDTGGIKNIAADSVTYSDSNLDIDIKILSGSYSGKVTGNKITGEWKQPGGTLKLELTPYEKPVEVPTDPLLGEWAGKLDIQGIKLTVVFRYSKDRDGNFTGFVDIPEQSANNLPVKDVTLAGDEVRFAVPVAQLKYKGTFEGEKISGSLIQGTVDMKLTLEKGKYEVPQAMLDVSDEAMEKLKGEWAGTMTFIKDLPTPVRVRFEETDEGKSRAFIDIPSENQMNRPLSDIKLTGDRLSMKTGLPRYEGTLKGNVISGHYIIANMKFELDLTKGAELKIIKPEINISEDIMKKLSGRWKGQISGLTVFLTFNVNDRGENEAFLDIPDQGEPEAPFLRGSVSGSSLTIKTAASEISGEIKEEKIEGFFKALGNVIPVTFIKEK